MKFWNFSGFLLSGAGIGYRFCINGKIDRSRSSGGVGWTSAACYTVQHTIGVGRTRKNGVPGPHEKNISDDPDFCTQCLGSGNQFSDDPLKSFPRELETKTGNSVQKNVSSGLTFSGALQMLPDVAQPTCNTCPPT